MRYFCGTSDTSDKSDTSNTADSSVTSKTSASVTRLSSYFSGLGRAFGRRVSSRDGKKILGIAGVRAPAGPRPGSSSFMEELGRAVQHFSGAGWGVRPWFGRELYDVGAVDGMG